MHTAIAVTSQTIAQYLRQQLESDDQQAAMAVSISHPKELVGQQFEGLSVWLYRVAVDEAQRNFPSRRGGAPLPLRLHYLVTPMTAAGGDGASPILQTVLGRAMQALQDQPHFPGFEMRFEALSLEAMTEMWIALDLPYQLSVSYEVVGVQISE